MKYKRKKSIASRDKRLDEPVFTPLNTKDIISYMHMKIIYNYKKNTPKYIPRSDVVKIANFITTRRDPSVYQIWVFLKSVTPKVISLLDNNDFISLIDIIRDQADKYHRKELMIREYKPSKHHPFNASGIPVYRKSYDGTFYKIQGQETTRTNRYFSFGLTYSKNLSSYHYQCHEKLFLNPSQLLHLKDHYKIYNESNFQSFEQRYISAISDGSSDVNVSMNMLDRNQYELANDSEQIPRESSTASSLVSSIVQVDESNRINLRNNNTIRTQEIET